MQHLATIVQRGWSPASTAFVWWRRELAEVVPRPVREWIVGRDRQVVICVASNEVYLDGVDKAAIPIVWEKDRKFSPAVSARIESVGCLFLLPASVILRRTLELPLAAEADIVTAAAFFIPQVTPFTLEQVYYSCRPLERDRVRGVVRFEMIVLPARVVSAWVSTLVVHGLSVSAIRIEGEDRIMPLAFPIGPARGAARRSSWQREPWKLTLAISAILLAIVPPLIVKQVHANAEALRIEAAEVKIAGQKTALLQAEVDALSNAANFLPRHLAGPSPIDILAELTTLLPDDTWLFSLSLSAGEVRVAGFSAAVPKALQSLQAAHSFGAPELLGSVVHGAGQDRFEIKMKVARPAS